MKYPAKPYYYDYSTDEDYQKALEDWEYICDMIDLEADGKRVNDKNSITQWKSNLFSTTSTR